MFYLNLFYLFESEYKYVFFKSRVLPQLLAYLQKPDQFFYRMSHIPDLPFDFLVVSLSITSHIVSKWNLVLES